MFQLLVPRVLVYSKPLYLNMIFVRLTSDITVTATLFTLCLQLFLHSLPFITWWVFHIYLTIMKINVPMSLPKIDIYQVNGNIFRWLHNPVCNQSLKTLVSRKLFFCMINLINTAIPWKNITISAIITPLYGSWLQPDDAIWYEVWWFALKQVKAWIQGDSKPWLWLMLTYCWFVIWDFRNKLYRNSNPFMHTSFQKICLKLFWVATSSSMYGSVLPSISLSVCLSVTPSWQCSHRRIIMKFSGVINNHKNYVHAKGQSHRSKVKVTEVMTQLTRFRSVTPVWIHVWWWNDAQSLWYLGEVPYCFSRSFIKFQGHLAKKKASILTQFWRFRAAKPVWIHQWLRDDAQSSKLHR